ncbi:MAG: arylsulfatase [Pirellulales bacterium]|nr:arylsulfatase [Pirellulales bacterium]
MGYSDLGCFGGEINTPNLDGLAKNGIRFTQFYNGARCCPTRASLMTGLYPHEAGMGRMTGDDLGIPGYRGGITKETVTIAEVLRDAGYRTAMVGKWHAGSRPKEWPENRGFDRFHGIHHWVDSYWKVLPLCEVYENGKIDIPATEDPPNRLHPDKEWYTTDVFTDWALEYIDEASKSDKPLFLYVAYNSPHFPLEAPDEDIARYRNRYAEGWAPIRRERLKRMKQLGIVPKNTKLSRQIGPTWASLGEQQRKELVFRRAIYAAQIDRMDQNIGRIVDRLRQNRMLDNTLILFLSDNGCSAEIGMFGLNFDKYRIDNFDQWRKASGWSVSQGEAWANASNTPFKKYKKWAHEGGMRTPLIAHWPKGIKKTGQLSHEPGHIVDVMASCVDLAETEYPSEYNGHVIKPMKGLSLVPLLRGEPRESHKAIYCEHFLHASVRMGQWKLVTVDFTKPKRWELYNIEKDPSEVNNLAASNPQRVAAMKASFEAWAKEANVVKVLKKKQ